MYVNVCDAQTYHVGIEAAADRKVRKRRSAVGLENNQTKYVQKKTRKGQTDNASLRRLNDRLTFGR